MKTTKLLLMIGILFFLGCHSANKEKEDSDGTPINTPLLVEKTVHIGGMHCDMCEASIEKGINELDGIEHVEASWNDSITVVKYDETVTSMEDIEKAIEKRGYSVKSFENN
jgi:Cu+-exporting ATPase